MVEHSGDSVNAYVRVLNESLCRHINLFDILSVSWIRVNKHCWTRLDNFGGSSNMPDNFWIEVLWMLVQMVFCGMCIVWEIRHCVDVVDVSCIDSIQLKSSSCVSEIKFSHWECEGHELTKIIVQALSTNRRRMAGLHRCTTSTRMHPLSFQSFLIFHSVAFLSRWSSHTWNSVLFD